jgi:endonuclease/exonuclease/phosphatase family metal-dependent hydrolase
MPDNYRESCPRSRLLALVAVACLLLVTFSSAAQAKPVLKLKVMTQNLYLGADISDGLGATDFSQLVAAATREFAMVQATSFPERAKAIATQVAATTPDVIGLQEAVLWRSQTPADFSPTPNATHVEFDFVQLLLDALAAKGLRYAPIPGATATNTDVEVPRQLTAASPTYQDIRLTDRDVLLARSDLPANQFAVSNGKAAAFATQLSFPSPLLGSITILRSWVSADATLQGETVRVVDTHLESLSDPINAAQGLELLHAPLSTSLPVILVGDLNSAAPAGVAYTELTGAGLTDAWTAAHMGSQGFTCCQQEDLRNPVSLLDQRIDFVMYKGAFQIQTVSLMGAGQVDRTTSGLWPSDHAGVYAKLVLP